MSSAKVRPEQENTLKGNIGRRIAQIRHTLDLTQQQLAERVGGAAARTIGGYEAGKRIPQADWCVTFAEEFGLKLEWLLTGQGLPHKEPQELVVGAPQGQILETTATYRSTVPEVEIKVVAPDPADPLLALDAYRAVPYVGDPASAGEGRVVRDEIIGYVLIHQRVAPHPEHLCCIRITGHSMANVLPDGSIVAIDRTRNIQGTCNRHLVCARTPDDDIVIKRLQIEDNTVRLVSENKDQETFRPFVFDIMEYPHFLIGQVIWAWLDLRFATFL